MVPITYQQLLNGFPGTAEEAFKDLQAMIGDTIWQKFYGTAAVKVDTYAPAQMASILSAVFAKLDKDTKVLSAGLTNAKQTFFTEVEEQDELDRDGRTGAYATNQY